MSITKAILLVLLTTVVFIWLTARITSANIFSKSDEPISTIQAGPMSVEIIQTPTPTPIASPTPSSKPIAQKQNNQNTNGSEWGKAVQTENGSYTMKVGMDDKMTTPNELYEALMAYRQVKGKSRLSWDDKLTSYALERATFICKNGRDGHAGFNDFINNQGGFDKLGFAHLGENMSGGMRLSGVHLVEWIYSQSPGHEKNQLGDWSHIGVGVTGDCSVLIFGGSKM